MTTGPGPESVRVGPDRKATGLAVLPCRTRLRDGRVRVGGSYAVVRPEEDPVAAYTVVGGGAIGTTLAVALRRSGRDVELIDVDPLRVAALRAGVVLRDGVHAVT